MYIVNTTFVVEPAQQERWLQLMREDYIPILSELGMGKVTFTRVISVEQVEHFTYALMVEAESMEDYNTLTREAAERYHAFCGPLFDQPPMWFTTLLKKIEL